MTDTGIVARLYCNQCGGTFETTDHQRRFCSIQCANSFWAPLKRRMPGPLVSWAQDAILTKLRQAHGEWVERGEIVQMVYGVNDPSSRHCFTMALHRLRNTWGANGLVIGCRVRRVATDHDAGTYYRLESDIDLCSEVAS